jgi:hypothetical protein
MVEMVEIVEMEDTSPLLDQEVVINNKIKDINNSLFNSKEFM